MPLIKIFGKRVVLNLDGAEWKRGKWSKQVQKFLMLSEKIGVKYADVVITDNKCIQTYVGNEYGVSSELIAYGGDNAQRVELTEDTKQKYGISNNGYAFKVCRIEPENNIDLILEAFSKCDAQLILVGNWKRSHYGENLRNRYKSHANLKLLDAIYDQKQLDEICSNCSLYIHGHSVGGTNPSLVEAMNLGLACIVLMLITNARLLKIKLFILKILTICQDMSKL